MKQGILCTGTGIGDIITFGNKRALAEIMVHDIQQLKQMQAHEDDGLDMEMDMNGDIGLGMGMSGGLLNM